jgi:hypothetical protein
MRGLVAAVAMFVLLAAPAAARGSLINVTYKSGTKEFRGTDYELLRNFALDAKNFFDEADRAKPPFKLNQFGFNLGGPLSSQNCSTAETSCSFSATTRANGPPLTDVHQARPIAEFRRGDFSSLSPRTVIMDPRTTPRTPFAGNILPPSLLNPTSLRMVSLPPLLCQSRFCYGTARIASVSCKHL